jgi:hypothetical protein
MAAVHEMQTFALTSDEHGVITWNAPDGERYELDPALASTDHWLLVEDRAGQPVMGYLTRPGEDGTLLLSLEGACSLAATLLHDGDDHPRKLYWATDEGNDNRLQRPAFILRAQDVEGSPGSHAWRAIAYSGWTDPTRWRPERSAASISPRPNRRPL